MLLTVSDSSYYYPSFLAVANTSMMPALCRRSEADLIEAAFEGTGMVVGVVSGTAGTVVTLHFQQQSTEPATANETGP